MMVQNLVQSCINIILPSGCAVCGQNPAIYPLPICRECKNLILSGSSPPVFLSDCLQKIWSCRHYEGVVRECIRKFKYCGKRQLLPVFEDMIRKFLSENQIAPGFIDLVVPVPIHPKRRRGRGYNQSELISHVLSEQLSSPASFSTLIKTKNTAPQMGLSGKNRINNLKHSFAVPERLRLAGKSVMLVDDIITTGITLNTCGAELLHAGAKEVYGFTLARTM
jgi:competence protein ComFC